MPYASQPEILRVAICDDNPPVLEKMQEIVERTLSPFWELIVFRDTSPRNLLSQAGAFQILVLDIQLLEENGITFANKILSLNPDCRIIFDSGFLCYVSAVYDVPHIGMVLKDQMEEQLPKFLMRAAAEASSLSEQALIVNVKGELLRLWASDIRFLERREHITQICLKSGQALQTRDKLDVLLAQTSSPELCRCHVSYAVNLRWVASMQGKDFILRTGECIPISRANMQAAKAAFFRYLREMA